MFNCEKCGACCRQVGETILGKNMALPNGVCKFLDQNTNLCRQYGCRPIFCNVDMYYERYLEKYISREEWYEENIKMCRLLKNIIVPGK